MLKRRGSKPLAKPTLLNVAPNASRLFDDATGGSRARSRNYPEQASPCWPTRSVVSVAPRLLHIAPCALLWWAKVVRGRVSVCSLVIPCQLMPLIRQLSALFRLRISKLAPHGGQLSDTICEPGLVWRKSCFGGTVICTSGHHSALLHPSPSIRVTLADR